MSNFFIEKRQVTIVKLLKTRWANKLKNLLNQEKIVFTRMYNIYLESPDLPLFWLLDFFEF